MRTRIENRYGNIMMYLLAVTAGLALLLPGFAAAQAIIEKVAGGKVEAENVPALSVSLYYPTGIAVDGSGNLYIADTSNNRIRKVTAAGTISTVAGTGVYGYSGDGGAATAARLAKPTGVAVDGSGNLFIADRENHCIRKVDTSGLISTVAGNNTWGYSGDGGPATSAQLYDPDGVAVDGSGNLYIADTMNKCIRKVNSSGVISTVAGNNTWGYSGDGGPAIAAQLSYPYGVAVDSSGNFYIADRGNYRIRRVDAAGTISTVAGDGTAGYGGDGGPATAAQLNNPSGIVFDGSGNFYIADRGNYRIRRVDAAGVISTVAGVGTAGYSGDGGPATAALLSGPAGVAADGSGNLYIADRDNQRIRSVDVSGTISTVAGNGTFGHTGDGGAAVGAMLNNPKGVAPDSGGSLYIADTNNSCIRKVDTSGTISTVAGNGTAGYGGDGGTAMAAQLSLPAGVGLDSSSILYIADTNNSCIRKVDTSGTISTVAGNGTAGYSGDGGAATAAQLNLPAGVALDSSGILHIADSSNHCIRRVDAAGVISTIAGTGTAGYSGDGGAATAAQLKSPAGVALDSSGAIYIADSSNHRIRMVDTAGVISTVAGTGDSGYWGDGGPATEARLFAPIGTAVDTSGRLFVADSGNHLIRSVNTAVPTTTTTTVDPGTTTTTIYEEPTTTTTVPKGPCPAGRVLGEDNPKTDELRALRDGSLAQSALGRTIIRLYYTNAGSISAALDRSPALLAIVRRALNVLVPMAWR